MYSARESSSRKTVRYSAREQSSTNAGQKAQECQGHGNSSIRLHLVPTLLCTCGNPIVLWFSSSSNVLGNSMFNSMYWLHKMICNVYLRISLFYSLLLTIWTFVSLGLSGALYDISCRVHLCSKTYLLNKIQLWRSPYPPHWRHNFPTAWPSHSSGLAIIRKLLIVLFFSSYFVFVFCNIWSSSLEALFSYSLAKSRMGSC